MILDQVQSLHMDLILEFYTFLVKTGEKRVPCFIIVFVNNNASLDRNVSEINGLYLIQQYSIVICTMVHSKRMIYVYNIT